MVTQRRACDACYQRKIQCDAAETGSQCNWCHHHSIPCTFKRVRGRQKRTKSGRPSGPGSRQDLIERLGRVEEQISLSHTATLNDAGHTTLDVSPSSTSGSSDSAPPASPLSYNRACPTCRMRGLDLASVPSSRLTNTVLGQIYFAGQNIGTVCSRNGIPHLTAQGEQWIYSRTGERPSFQRLYDSDAPSAHRYTGHSPPLQLSHRPTQGRSTELPERWILQSMLHSFLCSDVRLVFPLVDPVLFQETVRLAYMPQQSAHPPLEHISAKACVFAFLAVVSNHFPQIEGAQFADADATAREAQMLLSDFLEDISITTLQTVIMLMLHETLCGHFQAGSMYHAVACRTIFALGGHILVVPPKSGELSVLERENSHLRMLFWFSYLFDKDIALRTGQPPIISDDFCDLTLPEGYAERRFCMMTADNSDRPSAVPYDSLQTPWHPGDLRLSLLKSKACHALYSAASLRKSDAELLRTIRELDEELESWRLSLPAEFSPSLSRSKHTRRAADLTKSSDMLHIELHLDYHYLLNLIHCASGRCMVDWSGGPVTEKMFGVQSSLELSVEASRSTLIFLSAEAHRLAGEAFWAFIFYPVSALMTLFFNILRNPLGEDAVQDVELLSSAASLIRSMPMQRVTAHEMAYLRSMDDFVAELSRLGKCAIAKWQNERDRGN